MQTVVVVLNPILGLPEPSSALELVGGLPEAFWTSGTGSNETEMMPDLVVKQARVAYNSPLMGYLGHLNADVHPLPPSSPCSYSCREKPFP